MLKYIYKFFKKNVKTITIQEIPEIFFENGLNSSTFYP